VSSPDDVVAQVRAAEDRRYAAMLAADVGALDGLLSDRLVYTHSSGSRDTKESFLSKMRSGALAYVSVEHPESQLIVLGDAVLIIGEMHAEIQAGGASRRLDNASLSVWAAEDGGWRLAAFQNTPLPR
jgi:ketosteroid isomerase-like protein